MSTVICEATFGGKPYAIPMDQEILPFGLSARLEQISEIMVPMAKIYKEHYTGGDEIRLTWDEDKFLIGQAPVIPFSPTIHVADLWTVYESHIQPPPPALQP